MSTHPQGQILKPPISKFSLILPLSDRGIISRDTLISMYVYQYVCGGGGEGGGVGRKVCVIHDYNLF